MQKSIRGELEITNLNQMYLDDEQLAVVVLGRGYTWMDAGTMDSLYEATNFVRAVERSQDVMVAALEETAYYQGWIDKDTLRAAAEKWSRSPYGRHLQNVAEGRIIFSHTHPE